MIVSPYLSVSSAGGELVGESWALGGVSRSGSALSKDLYIATKEPEGNGQRASLGIFYLFY